MGKQFFSACRPQAQAPSTPTRGKHEQHNPYEAPRAEVDDRPSHSADLQQIASGQKLTIYSIILNVAGIALQHPPVLLLLASLAAIVMSIVGIVRLCGGFGHSAATKVFLVIGCFVPLLNLIILVALSMKATGRLREAGYKVGLLGASRA